MSVARILVAALVLALSACTAFTPRSIELSQERLQEVIARRFPVERRLLDAIDLTVDSPRVLLQPELNRIAVELALRANAGSASSARILGALRVSQALRFEASDNTVRAVDVEVERFAVEGLPSMLQRQLERFGKPMARALLEDQVLYALRPKDVAALAGRNVRPGDLRVTSTGIEITLVPAAP